MSSAAFRLVSWLSVSITQQCQRFAGLRCNNPTFMEFPRITVQADVFPFFLLSLTALAIDGCSSGSLLGIVEPTTEIAVSPTVAPYSKSTFGLYDISTFDVYVDGDVIHIIAGGKNFAKDKQVNLRYTRSEDGGRKWQDSVSLANHPTSINTRGNDIQLTAKGTHLLAVWQSKGELPGMGPMVSAHSQDNGKTWTKGANPALNNAGDQSHVDLIADQHSVFHAIWLEDPEENGYQSLRYSRSVDWGNHWGHAITLDDSTCSCCWNTFALSPDGSLNILYRDMKPRDMSLLQSSDEGKTWKHVSTVGEFGWQFDGCPHNGGSLAYLGADNPKQLLSLVWTGADKMAGMYYLSSTNNGTGWSKPKKLGNNAIHGDIATFDGKIVAVWDEMDADGSGIFYAKSDDDGITWSSSTRLTVSNNAATHPRLVTTRHGLLALWTERPNKQPGQLAWQFIE